MAALAFSFLTRTYFKEEPLKESPRFQASCLSTTILSFANKAFGCGAVSPVLFDLVLT